MGEPKEKMSIWGILCQTGMSWTKDLPVLSYWPAVQGKPDLGQNMVMDLKWWQLLGNSDPHSSLSWKKYEEHTTSLPHKHLRNCFMWESTRSRKTYPPKDNNAEPAQACFM